MRAVLFSLVFIPLMSFASEKTYTELETDAEVVAWYVACQAIASNNTEMTEMAITFNESFKDKQKEVNQLPKSQLNFVIKMAKEKSLKLVKERFIIASCKDLHKTISTIQNMQ